MLPCSDWDGSSRLLLRAFTSISLELMYTRYFITSQKGPKRNVYFCGDFPGLTGRHAIFCDRQGLFLFLFHKCCWKLVNQPVALTSSLLLRLAQHTQPILPPMVRPGSPALPLSRQAPIHIRNEGTPLGRLLADMTRRLPPEIQGMVLDYMAGSLLASLLKTNSVVPSLLQRLNPTGPLDPKVVDVGSAEAIHSIHIRTSDVFGRSYLTHIEYNRPEDISSIPIKPLALKGIQYALGEFGLRALRILYKDGSRSAWLGDPSSCWYGTAAGKDLKTLRVLTDVSWPSLFPHSPTISFRLSFLSYCYGD